MMMDKRQIYEAPSLTHATEGVSDELEPKRKISTEAGDEVVHEGAEEVPKPFVEEVLRGGDHEEDIYTEVKHEEDIFKTFP